MAEKNLDARAQALIGKHLAGTMGSLANDILGEAWRNENVGIEHHGKVITLPAEPANMPIDAAIEALQRRKVADEQEFDLHEHIPGYFFEAAVAFHQAMVEEYGWADAQSRMGFFGPIAPDMLTVQVGPNPEDTVQVPFGQFKLPNIENPITTGQHIDISGGQFAVMSSCKKKDQHVVMALVARAKRIMATSSIYKGKALRLSVDDRGNLREGFQPSFLKTAHVDVNSLILSASTEDLLATTVFTPIVRTKEVRKHGIPLRRGILLEGPYGVGKSMTAAVISRLCVDNGWTYILIDKVQGLKAALEFAKRYQPAVVFAEDIDRIAEIRDEKANDLLNTIDGVVTKDSEVMTVLTTNHVEKINPAMLRPGRLDAVISIEAPDANAAVRLVRQYGGLLVDPMEDLTKAGEVLSGKIPAMIREVVERSKLSMLYDGRSSITSKDLTIAAYGMEKHLALLAPKPAEKSPGDQLAHLLKEVILGKSPLNGKTPAVHVELDGLKQTTRKIAEALDVTL